MTPVDELRALKERVEAARGADWHLDMDIAWAVSEWRNLGGGWRKHKITGAEEKYDYGASHPPITASTDAALALVERVLPGSLWSVDRPVKGGSRRVGRKTVAEPYCAYISKGLIGTADYVSAIATSVSPPLAILSALLSALTDRAEKELAG